MSTRAHARRTILALALGNPLRGDDGAGRAIAEGLAALVPGLEVAESQELLPEHAERAACAAAVLFLDAAVGGPPGAVRCQPVTPRTARAAVLHALPPEEILGLAHALYGRAPPAALVTITGASFAFGEGLSAAVQAALPEARRQAAEAAAAFPPRRPPEHPQ